MDYCKNKETLTQILWTPVSTLTISAAEYCVVFKFIRRETHKSRMGWWESVTALRNTDVMCEWPSTQLRPSPFFTPFCTFFLWNVGRHRLCEDPAAEDGSLSPHHSGVMGLWICSHSGTSAGVEFVPNRSAGIVEKQTQPVMFHCFFSAKFL